MECVCLCVCVWRCEAETLGLSESIVNVVQESGAQGVGCQVQGAKCLICFHSQSAVVSVSVSVVSFMYQNKMN